MVLSYLVMVLENIQLSLMGCLKAYFIYLYFQGNKILSTFRSRHKILYRQQQYIVDGAGIYFRTILFYALDIFVILSIGLDFLSVPAI